MMKSIPIKEMFSKFLTPRPEFFIIPVLCISTVIFSQEIKDSTSDKKSDKQKFQIQIEDELEEGSKSANDKSKETEDIVITGEDEQLIRTSKSDTSFISPTDPSSIRWMDDRSLLDKDGKVKQKGNEKSGDFIPAYGMYDSSFLNLKIAKSDKFGLYQLRYIRDNIVSEGFNGARIANSAKSSDDVKVTVGSRILPNYLMMFNARYQGDNVGYQSNIFYRDLFRRWGNFSLQNSIKPEDKQMIHLDVNANYLQSKYGALTLPESDTLYLNAGLSAQWTYIFEDKVSIEANGVYDFQQLKDIDRVENKASTIQTKFLFHIPLVKNYVGNSKSLPWQLDITAGGGSFSKDGLRIEPTGSAFIDSKLDFWNLRLGAEKVLENLKMEESHLSSYFEKAVYYQKPLNYWHIFTDNSFLINKENAVKAIAGYKQYDRYYNLVLDSQVLYYRVPETYKEIYGRINWEFSFLRSFLLETSIDINGALSSVNMRPFFSFLIVLNYDTERFDAALSFKAVGQRKLDSISLNDYYLLGVNLKFWLNPSFALMASAENILNQKYMEYYPYQTSGIKIFAGCYIKI